MCDTFPTAYPFGPDPSADPDAGPTVALVHGLEDDWRSWRSLVRELRRRETLKNARFRALDLPWRSGCDYTWRRATTPSDWVDRGLGTLAQPPQVVIAHSFGANAVLELLATRPSASQPMAVVLIAPFYRPPSVPVTWKLFEQSRDNFNQQMHDGVVARLSRRGRVIEEDVLESMIRKTVERVGPSGFLAVFDQFVGSGELRLADVRPPTLVLAGARDPGLGRRRGAVLTEEMPAADVVLHEEWDHFCHIRHADEVATRITGFLDTLHHERDGAEHRERSA
ncbi:alpha/beta fold hydrolase [Salinactinospora qingdaonensis]|uniref:Pimeloyl-ACP methyl ester carboxylesterase n=1 Tax=Salinactinospora qingdaonensis TaxID=702744 RepID=A0ABP7F959_9ACTN